MADTLDVLVKLDWNQGSHEMLSIKPADKAAQSITRFQFYSLRLASQTANYEVALGTGFTTANYVAIKETNGYTFTFSLNNNASHHKVAANGFVCIEAPTTHIYVSNNNAGAANANADLEIWAAG
jgi:hypothetical protein